MMMRTWMRTLCFQCPKDLEDDGAVLNERKKDLRGFVVIVVGVRSQGSQEHLSFAFEAYYNNKTSQAKQKFIPRIFELKINGIL